MKKLKNALALFLIPVFLFGTVGITVFHHECLSANRIENRIFPEIFKSNEKSCCCEEETAQVRHDVTSLGYDSPDCCRTFHLYMKADFLAISKIVMPENPVPAVLPCPQQNLFRIEKQIHPDIIDKYFSDPSPPPSGKILIHLIHQIRIPVSDHYLA
ncbi:MAG: hypothetical protein Q8867_01745 [Bacteroidota bacterium]|nr:hypothetical protein [Bacteroidota bacterium]